MPRQRGRVRLLSEENPIRAQISAGLRKPSSEAKKPYGTFQIVKIIYEYTGHVFYGLVTAELLASPFLYEGVSHEKPGDVKSQKWT